MARYQKIFESAIRSKQHVPHLIGRGHTRGHNVDQLLLDCVKSDGTSVPLHPFSCTFRHKLTVLNQIVTRLGVKGSQVQILSARLLRTSSQVKARAEAFFYSCKDDRRARWSPLLGVYGQVASGLSRRVSAAQGCFSANVGHFCRLLYSVTLLVGILSALWAEWPFLQLSALPTSFRGLFLEAVARRRNLYS